MIAWMLYTVIVGLCAVVAARAADWMLRVRRRPSRFAWIGAALFSIALAASAPLRARAVHNERGQQIDLSSLELMQTSIRSVERSVPPSTVWYLVGFWAVATLLVTSTFVVAYCRLRRARRAWPVVDLHGHRVRLSPSVGPIVVGIVRPEIIVPRWVLARSIDEQRMILGHEAAHVRAGDHLLLGAACALVGVMPWNPAFWIILSRVRLAIEVDCDARVLRGDGVSPRSYGSLLIDVAEHASPVRLAATALADDASHLHQRILAMQPRRLTHALLRGASVAVIGVAGLLVACEAKMPTAADVQQMDARSAERDAQKLGMLPADSSVVWSVDGIVSSEAVAKAISRDSIAAVEVGKFEGRAHIYVTTKVGQKVGFATKPETLRVARRRAGHVDDSVAVIRKLQTAAASEATPILFIDGVRADVSALKTIDRTRIDRVEVLKGPLALGLYGADASNGVIVITTKPAIAR
jgi:TonB-dependent SusC/RagA subfamily outer membrane receptor